MNNNTVYLKGLNGLRAIAALLIMFGHTTGLFSFGFNLPLLIVGFDGVTLFFVISGFLITYLLLKEKEKNGKISIGKFYMRRILRIWPIYYLMIGVGLLISLADARYTGEFLTKSSFFYIFFAANIPFIFHQSIPMIVHYWSIGVEEQFYLFWPWLMKFSGKFLITKILFFIVTFFIIKSLLWYLKGIDYWLYDLMSVTRFHCMLTGALGAVIFYRNYDKIIRLISHFSIQLISWILAALIAMNILILPAPLTAEITAVISLFIIIGQVQGKNKIPVNLEKEWLDFLGKISYGIYVIHPFVILLFVYLYKNLNLNFYLQNFVVYSSVLILTVLFSYLSYNYFEKPFLKLKSGFAVVKSSGTKHFE
jgi:peptidoglycan/LPS O-acetylase OafA/YrhL